MDREDIIKFIAAHKAKFEQEFGLKRIGLFGSYASVTHHYFDIDAETMFVACKERIPGMKKVISKIINDLEGRK